MAIYETSARQGLASISFADHRLLYKLFDWTLIGPKRVIEYSQSRSDPFARGSNEVVPWNITLQTSFSIGFWCIGFLTVSCQTWLPQRYPHCNDKIKSTIRTVATSSAKFFRNIVRKVHSIARNDDLTITVHTGSCLCGKVKFDVKAPRTLYVEEIDEDAPIAYPQTCLPIPSFILKQGRKSLQSFRNNYAYTFCSQCGMHILRVSEQNSPDLYLNMLCLKKGSFVARPSWEQPQTKSADTKNEPSKSRHETKENIQQVSVVPSQPRRTVIKAYESEQPDRTDRLSPSISSDDYGELVIAPQEDEPNFTVTAASSISSVEASATSMEYGDDLSTSRYEETAYRLRKALVSETKKEEAQAPETVNATLVSPSTDMIGSFLAVETSLATREIHDDEKPATFPARNNAPLNQSYASSTDSASDEETREQLRRFMSKHVQTQSFQS